MKLKEIELDREEKGFIRGGKHVRAARQPFTFMPFTKQEHGFCKESVALMACGMQWSTGSEVWGLGPYHWLHL
eukprot:scaffold218266_cov15-Tisochrysis_lutea.AAC.1